MKKKKSIGEMTNSRLSWGFDSSTRVVGNKKGKGSYKRKKLNQSLKRKLKENIYA
jgi:hypothetical protein